MQGTAKWLGKITLIWNTASLRFGEQRWWLMMEGVEMIGSMSEC
jgi:hypothetical protein